MTGFIGIEKFIKLYIHLDFGGIELEIEVYLGDIDKEFANEWLNWTFSPDPKTTDKGQDNLTNICIRTEEWGALAYDSITGIVYKLDNEAMNFLTTIKKGDMENIEYGRLVLDKIMEDRRQNCGSQPNDSAWATEVGI